MRIALKFIGVIFCFLINNSLQAQLDDDLVGRWELMKIETEPSTIIADSGKYQLEINEEDFKFNTGINQCWCDGEWMAESGEIKFLSLLACTEVGGDEKYGNLFGKLKYSGKYEIKELGTILLIKNDKGLYYLKRID